MRITAGMMMAVLLGGSTWAVAQTSGTVKDDLFAGTEKFAANASSVTEVDMDPDSLGMVNGQNALRARRTVLSVVHTYTYDKPGMYNIADVEAFRNKLNTGEWHCSVHVRELKSGESTDVCRKHRTDEMEETAIVTVEPKELTFIHTIKRPYTQPNGKGEGKSGSGGESRMVVPYEREMPWGMADRDGMPAAAWGAEMRADAAEMRAMAKVDRAEMEAMRPALRANLLGSGAATIGRQRFFDEDQIRSLTRQFNTMPNLELKRLQPTAPQTPTAPEPGTPPASSVPRAPAAGPAPMRAMPAPPLPPARA